MSRMLPEPLLRLNYERWAQEYLKSLPPEHFMESVAQSFQKLVLMAALQLVHLRRPDIQPFSELLIQYEAGRPRERRGVVPDVMAVVHPTPIRATTTYGIEVQPVKPTLVFECVSNSNPRKDYDVSFRKYERDLKIPYYLMFYPDNHELTLFHLSGRRYTSVLPDAQGRYAIPEMEIQVGVRDEWLRVWFRGDLMGTTAELQASIDGERHARLAAEERAESAEAEVARLRAEVERLRRR